MAQQWSPKFRKRTDRSTTCGSPRVVRYDHMMWYGVFVLSSRKFRRRPGACGRSIPSPTSASGWARSPDPDPRPTPTTGGLSTDETVCIYVYIYTIEWIPGMPLPLPLPSPSPNCPFQINVTSDLDHVAPPMQKTTPNLASVFARRRQGPHSAQRFQHLALAV